MSRKKEHPALVGRKQKTAEYIKKYNGLSVFDIARIFETSPGSAYALCQEMGISISNANNQSAVENILKGRAAVLTDENLAEYGLLRMPERSAVLKDIGCTGFVFDESKLSEGAKKVFAALRKKGYKVTVTPDTSTKDIVWELCSLNFKSSEIQDYTGLDKKVVKLYRKEYLKDAGLPLDMREGNIQVSTDDEIKELLLQGERIRVISILTGESVRYITAKRDGMNLVTTLPTVTGIKGIQNVNYAYKRARAQKAFFDAYINNPDKTEHELAEDFQVSYATYNSGLKSYLQAETTTEEERTAFLNRKARSNEMRLNSTKNTKARMRAEKSVI